MTSLATLLSEIETPAPPKGWWIYTACEVLFLVGFFAVVIICGGGQ